MKGNWSKRKYQTILFFEKTVAECYKNLVGIFKLILDSEWKLAIDSLQSEGESPRWCWTDSSQKEN